MASLPSGLVAQLITESIHVKQAMLADQALLAQIGDVAQRVVDCYRNGGKVLLAGNGGSAADAQHIACELLGRFKCERQALPALALSTDSSTLTAIANDLGYDRIFERQLEGLVQPGDVVWALSTSGNSPNVLDALRVARERGGIIIGFSGRTGGKMAEMCDHLFHADHTSSDRIQEAHLIAYHYICERVEATMA